MEKFTPPEKYLGKLEIDSEGFVTFGDVARELLGRQAQYISSFADGLDKDTPSLSEGLRFKNMLNTRTGEATGNFHEYRIHKDDIEEFVKRVKEYQEQQ